MNQLPLTRLKFVENAAKDGVAVSHETRLVTEDGRTVDGVGSIVITYRPGNLKTAVVELHVFGHEIVKEETKQD